MKAPRDCPCHSGKRYKECCKPFHDGAEPPTPEALMRSRYSAFALALGGYIHKTCASTHPDRAEDPRELAPREGRYLGLTILETGEEGEVGHVKFHARIFHEGIDRSFTESSTFVKENGAWRYTGGEVVMDHPA